jgi:putative hydrolase of the HAD superfamily
LWYVEPLYDNARFQSRRIVEAVGLDGEEWERRERELDVMNVTRFGLSPKRFPTSCVQAYRLLAPVPDPLVEARIWSAASAVFAQSAPLAPDARSAVEMLRSVGRLALLTKGDETVQQQRLAQSGLAAYFDAVRVVEDKDENAFQAVLANFSCRPDRAWSVGNSLKSDIMPALALGMRAIWIDAHVWEYERSSRDVRASLEYLRADSLLAAAKAISENILSATGRSL